MSKSLIQLFLKLSKYNPKTKTSELVGVDEFRDTYQCLQFGNGGSWCRMDGNFGKNYKFITVKENGEIRYSWEPTTIEKNSIESELKGYVKKGYGKTIKYIKIYGTQTKNGTKKIREDIRTELLKNPVCVHCGTRTNIEIDHKNGLYNNPRVMNLKTQLLSDFQILCKHCNDIKRQTIKKMKETGIRHKATEIPMLSRCGKDYITGDERYDEKNPDTMIGTYWYDPIEFMKSVFKN